MAARPDFYSDANEWWGGAPSGEPYVEPAPMAAPVSGPPYTIHNPPPAGSAPPGTNWMLNPGTGEFEPIPIGSLPPWGARVDQPGTPAPVASPTPVTAPVDYGYSGGGGGEYFGGMAPPARTPLAALNYPALNLPRMQAPPAFSYEDFRAPTFEEAQNEPGFDYALKQGIKAYENSKAYTGTYRGGATIKGINDYARNMAAQNYGQVFDRKAQIWDRNRNNAASNYMTNYGVTRDVFDRNYGATKDEFAPKARGTELQFARDWDLFAYEGDDAYRRWKALVDANT